MKRKISSKQPKRRAIELFSTNSPFKPKIVKSKKIYSRKIKFKPGEL